MKRTFYLIATALLAVIFASCDQKEPVGPELNNDLTFELEMDSVEATSAKIKVSHSGTKEDTWYGFVTTESDPLDKVQDLVDDLIASGTNITLKKSIRNTYSVKDLTPGTEYTFIVVGLTSEGEVYGYPNSIEFTTKSEFTGITETQDWVLEYTGRDEEGKEHFTVECDDSSIYLFDYIDEYYITDPETNKSYLYEYIFATAEEIVAVLEQVSVADLLQAGYLQQGPGELASPQRLATGAYYVFAIGFNEDGTPTGTYSTKRFIVEEEEATEEYLQWEGVYTLQDANGAYFDIEIVPVDNNYMYALVGWETGEYFNRDENNDGEPDGMDFNSVFDDPATEEIEYVPVFPIYYNKGNIEFYEYIIMEQAELWEGALGDFGLYGWSTFEGEETPLYTGGALLGTGTTNDNGATGTITGGSVRTQSGSEIAIEAMCYTHISDNYYWWFNDPVKFPMTLTKKTAEGTQQQSMKPVSMDFKSKFNAPAQRVFSMQSAKDHSSFKASLSQKSAKTFRMFNKN